jgi:hypothetical protein
MRLFRRKPTDPTPLPVIGATATLGIEGYWYAQLVMESPARRRRPPFPARKTVLWTSTIPWTNQDDAIEYAWEHAQQYLASVVSGHPLADWIGGLQRALDRQAAT